MVDAAGTAHRVSGAQVAIVREGRVLVQLRPWPPGWEMPGGHCNAGERPEDTATREAAEETGLAVAVRGLVGVYTWAGLRRSSDAVYWAVPTGGERRRSIEALRTRFVTAEELPATVFPWVPQRLTDALAAAEGAAPVHRVQPVSWRHVLFFGTRWLAGIVDALQRRRGGER